MSRTPIAAFRGLGVAVPDGIVTNDDLSKTLDTTDQWIVERTGIRERRVARADESLTELTAKASRMALSRAGMSAEELDAIVVATVTPDRRMPSQACDLQAVLGANRAAAFDIVAACPGFVFAVGRGRGPHRLRHLQERPRAWRRAPLDHHRLAGSRHRGALRRWRRRRGAHARQRRWPRHPLHLPQVRWPPRRAAPHPGGRRHEPAHRRERERSRAST